MEREIKFRAWDTEENKYFKPEYEAYKGNLLDLSVSFSGSLMRRTLQFPSEHESCFKGRYILEQFTGKKDYLNTEVYDGDILQKECQGDSWKLQVYYSDEYACFMGKLIDSHWHDEMLSELDFNDDSDGTGYIIIGNIHTK